MGIIARHPDAPFVDGEVASAAPIEADFATIFAEVNGNLGTANLASLGVTTDKLAAAAVTQAKMTDGAASASEAQVETGAVGYPVSTSYGNVGSAVTHIVGSPARHVIVTASFLLVFQSTSTSMNVRLLKDGVSLQTQNFVDQVQNPIAAQNFQLVTRTYIDTAPTAGGTHVYQLQAKGVGAAVGVFNLNLIAFEPRS